MKWTRKEHLFLGAFLGIVAIVAVLVIVLSAKPTVKKEPNNLRNEKVHTDPYELTYQEFVSQDQALTGILGHNWTDDEELLIANVFDTSTIIRYQMEIIDSLKDQNTGSQLIIVHCRNPNNLQQIEKEWSYLGEGTIQASRSSNFTPLLLRRINKQPNETYVQLIRPFEQNGLITHLAVFQSLLKDEASSNPLGQFLLARIDLNK